MRIVGVGPFVYASFLAFALVHCGGESKSSGRPGSGGNSGSADPSGSSGDLNAFLGTWSCDSKSTIKVTMPAGSPDQMQETNFTFSVTKRSDSTITAGDATDPSCSGELTVSGSTASIEAPFECTQGDTMLKVKAESITVSGDKLTGTRTASVSTTTNTGEVLAGTGTTTIECARISGPPDGGATGTASCPKDATCVDCCSTHYPAGSDLLTNLLLDCTCQQCGTECAASLCSENSTTPADGDPCETCVRQALGDSGPCPQRAAAACQTNTDCSVLAACLTTCPSGSPI